MFNVRLKEHIIDTNYYHISKFSIFKHFFKHLMTPTFVKVLTLSFNMKTLNGKMIIDLGNLGVSSINLINHSQHS